MFPGSYRSRRDLVCTHRQNFWLLALLLLVCAQAHCRVIPATSYARHYFAEPESHAAVQKSGDLSGSSWGVAGWVEYDTVVDETGWYQLLSHGEPPAGVEFDVDINTASVQHFYRRGFPAATTTRVGNVWLNKGSHRLRLTRYFWTGFPKIASVELKRSGGDLVDSLQVRLASDQPSFRAGQCPDLVVKGGGGGSRGNLEVVDASADGRRIFGRYPVTIPASDEPVVRSIRLPCDTIGIHSLSVRADGRPVSTDALQSLEFQVVDIHTPGSSRPPADPVRPLLEIDCTKQTPDYASAQGTRLQSTPGLQYRESGDHGWIPYQRAGAADRRRMPEPDWFAYRIPGVIAGQRYRIDVDYPDDGFRNFAVVWRDPAPAKYPAAVAVETGREYPLSHAAQTVTFHAWAQAAGPRLVFMAPHDGNRAACLRIRVTLATPQQTPVPGRQPGRRQFINWYEEGENFAGFFGARDDSLESMNSAAQRWLDEAADLGINTVMPTVVVYNFAMYPSRFNRAFSEPERDTLRMLVLAAERSGMRIIPELHPRADELAYAGSDQRNLKNLAVSRDGRNNFMGEGGRNVPPYFNALDPRNQEWYLGALRELAERYRDSPALQGVSLRYMAWANPGLNNLVDLNWGYDDYSIGLYRAETGSKVPAGDASDAGRFARRHEWLMSREKEAWIRWRCGKLTQLLTRARDTLRAARPDLQLFLHVFGPTVSAAPAGSPPAGDFMSRLREAGLDIASLGKIDGLVLVNSSFSYGRGEQDALVFAAARDPLLVPVTMGANPAGPRSQWFLPASQHIEAIGEIVPPLALGFSSTTQPSWVSAASNPPGRQALERYAVLLAETDAMALGDGGNNQTLGSREVAGFAREFGKLPQLPFAEVAGATDPVMVRALQDEDAYYFYAVNRESYPVRISVELAGNGELVHRDESIVVHEGNRLLEIELQPYELRAVSGDKTLRISAVHTQSPEAALTRVAARLRWVENLLAGKSGRKPAAQDALVLRAASDTARDALDKGWLWRARTSFEISPVLQAFRRAGCSPPDMTGGVPDMAGCAALEDR